jgi:SecD/SecF fusion protein
LTGNQNRWMLIGILILAIAAGIVAFNPKIRAYYGLDIQGGLRVVLRAKTEEYEKREKKKWNPSENLEAVRRIMENRVNAMGVAEPAIITKAPDQIIVELPGLKDDKQAREQIKTTASLEFYLLPQLGNREGTMPAIWRISEDPTTKEEVLVDIASGQTLTKEQLEAAIFSREPVVTGRNMLPNSQAIIQPGVGKPVIQFNFDAEGARRFEETTRANIGKHLAIFLDRRLLTAPTINNVIAGEGVIEGNFTLETAKALSDQLNAGALPVGLEEIEIRKLEATLGREAVEATTRAGLIGLGLVVLFMLIWYRLPGFLATIALSLYTIFSIAIFKLWPITLTLPGIAGFILSIGMAVDANILIFERMKEELKSGKTLRAAIDAGFKRAFTAIFDSNVCTILTCFVLFNFGTGPIKGFALTLGIGVVVSMFTAITVTRTLLFALVRMGFAQNPAVYGLSDKPLPQLHVMRRKWLWFGLSFALILPGLIAMAMGGIKPSIDFRGGTEIVAPFATRHSADSIQQALATLKPEYKDSRVVVSSEPGAATSTAFITMKQLSDAERSEVEKTLVSKVGPLAKTPDGKEIAFAYSNVSGTVSNELLWDAIKAVVLASVLIVLYLAVRFSIGGFAEGLKYGTCAVAALLHDVFVVLGAFAILGMAFHWQVDSLFVTAMLTVVGFSVHDTIIVFDRVRENLHHRLKGETFSDLVDRSIDQTIKRSIYTSLTVVLTLLALFVAGGPTVHQFTGALLIGIISGTYSSIFNASVLLVLWKQRDLEMTTVTGPSGGGGSRLTAPKAAKLEPGDRPLVTPKAAKVTAVTEPQEAGEGETTTPDERVAAPKPAGSPRPSAPRRQPTRRRRM